VTFRNASVALLVWYSNLRLLRHTQALQQGMQAEPWKAANAKEEEQQQRYPENGEEEC
jgi:hypothetical protein